MLLTGYFDESNTHGDAKFTLIAGFVGDEYDWVKTERKWRRVLKRDGIRTFHYVDCKRANGEYKDWKDDAIQRHLESLAKIIGKSKLRAFSSTFLGVYEDAVAANNEWRERFPKAYNFCFEAAIAGVRKFSERHWKSSPIALVFSRQKEYAPRAMDVWEFHRKGGHWPDIASVTYGEPENVPALQMADMLAYDTQLYVRAGGGDAWKSLPLIKRLAERKYRPGAYGGGNFTPETFAEHMRNNPKPPTS